MNKFLLTALFILSFISLRANEVSAGFDAINNALMTSNAFLKEGALVQEKYSTVARNIVSTKVSVDIGIDTDKPQKLMEKAESAQEQAEGLQERMETTVEVPLEMQSRYADLAAQAKSFKDQAANALAEGQNIMNQYNTFTSQIADMGNSFKDMGNSVKDLAGVAKDSVKSQVGDLKDKAGISKNDSDEEQTISEESSVINGETNSETITDATLPDNEVVVENIPDEIATPAAEEIIETAPAQPVYNKADAIRSAGTWASMETAAVPSIAMQDDIAAFSDIPQAEVSVDDVMAVAATKEVELPSEDEEELHSTLNLEEQLKLSSNRTQAVKAGKLINKSLGVADLSKANKKELKPSSRAKFDKLSADKKEAIKGSLKNSLTKASKKITKEKIVSDKSQIKPAGQRKAFAKLSAAKEKIDAE